MAAIFYGIYVLISRSRYDEKLRVWLPYASVSSDGDKFYYYQLKNLDKSFETEDEALASASSLLAIGLTSIQPKVKPVGACWRSSDSLAAILSSPHLQF